jgi:hypothetical protein
MAIRMHQCTTKLKKWNYIAFITYFLMISVNVVQVRSNLKKKGMKLNNIQNT